MFWNKVEVLSLLDCSIKKGFALISDGVGVRIVLLAELSLGESILKLCNVGVPVILGGSDCLASVGLIMLESISDEPYETNNESCVGNDKEDLRRAPKSSLLSGRSRRTVHGFSFPGFKLSSISGMLVCLLNLSLRYDVVFLDCYCCYYGYCLMTKFLRIIFLLLNKVRVVEVECMVVLVLLVV